MASVEERYLLRLRALADEMRAAIEAAYSDAARAEHQRGAAPHVASVEERQTCVCASQCGNSATATEDSPYMDDYCDDCTAYRCDIADVEHRPSADALTDFLLARIDEDEARARAPIAPYDWRRIIGFIGAGHVGVNVDVGLANATNLARALSPARILSECQAKRRIVEACEDCTSRPDDDPTCDGLAWLTLKHLALPYSNYADYRAEWRP